MKKKYGKWGNTFYAPPTDIGYSRSFNVIIYTSKTLNSYKMPSRMFETKNYNATFTTTTFTANTDQLVTPSTNCWYTFLNTITKGTGQFGARIGN